MMMKQILLSPVLCALAFATGQTSSVAPPRAASLDDVVTEVRALRGDLHAIAESSLRAQLLVARLQVEEQRVGSLARELTEIEQQMRALDGARNPMLTQMIKDFDAQPRQPGEPDVFAGVRAQLEKIENGDPVLKDRQASLVQQLADERARWMAFNSQLEALEKAASAPRK